MSRDLKKLRELRLRLSLLSAEERDRLHAERVARRLKAAGHDLDELDKQEKWSRDPFPD